MTEVNIYGTPFIAGRWPLDPSLKTIIFIHGAGNSKNLWRAQVSGLTGSFNTVAIDLPGHGESKENGLDTVAAYSDAVEEFIKAVNPPSPVLCGLSMGGAITLKLLLDGGINYSAGIIVNSGARLRVMPAIFEMIQNNYSGYTSSLPAMGASAKTEPGVIREIINDAKNCSPAVVHGDFTACNTFDMTERLGELTLPVLILTAEEDKLTPVRQGKFIHEHVKGSSYVNIPDAGHFSPVEKPDEVNAAIQLFLEAIE